MELNLHNALHDLPTLTELCVLALYMLSVSYPYLRTVRGENHNGLDLGPLHRKVRSHIQTLIDNPDLLLGNNVTAGMATLDGEEWEDEAGFKAVQNMLPTLLTMSSDSSPASPP